MNHGGKGWQNMKILIDTNIILDILLGRIPFSEEAEKLLEKIENNGLNGFITANSVTDIVYVAKKQYSFEEIKTVMLNLIKIIKVISVNEHDIIEAFGMGFKDFEDALQYQCASKTKLDYIVTRNEKDFKLSKIPVISIVELLNLL